MVLTLGPAAAASRRRLAPLAWCALEVLAEQAPRHVDGAVANVSVRSLAEELGVAKNTALRAIRTLRAAGLVEFRQERDGAGRYTRSGYRLTVPSDVLVAARTSDQRQSVEEPPATSEPTHVPKRRLQAQLVEQLVLLPVS